MLRREACRILGCAAWLLATLPACGHSSGEDLIAVGTLERRRIALAAPEAEKIVSLPVPEGSTVAAGTVVARLDDERLSHQVASLRSARDRARARLEELEHGTRPERIAQARAELARARARAALAAAEARRLRTLHEQEIASRQELDLRVAEAAEARAAEQLAAARLEELERGPRKEQIAQARAALAEAEARVAEAEARRAQLTLRAPEAATVDELPFEPGERPRPGDTVAVLLALDGPYARVFLSATDVADIRPGTEATVDVPSIGRTYRARVRTIAREAAFTPHFALTERERGRLVYEAEVALVDPEARDLATGIPVEVHVRPAPRPAPGPDQGR